MSAKDPPPISILRCSMPGCDQIPVHQCVCVCVCVCVRARARARAGACVRACVRVCVCVCVGGGE